MAEQEEIIGVYSAERHRFNSQFGDKVIASVYCEHLKKTVVIAGYEIDDDPFEPGCCYRFFGHWTKYTNPRTMQTQSQFQFKSYVQSTPQTQEGVISYIRQNGRGFGIGPVKALRIYEQFGADTLEVCRNNPKLVSEKMGIKPDLAELFAAKLKDKQKQEQVNIEMMAIMEGRGFPRETIQKAIAKWGNRAPRMIKKNPYLLMAFRGCGFMLCDKMYCSLGLNPTRLKRQALCVWHAIASNSFGSTWFPIQFVEKKLVEQFGADANLDKAVKIAERGGLITTRWTARTGYLTSSGNQLWIAERKKAAAELKISTHLVDAAREDVQNSLDVSEFDCSPHQIEQLGKSVAGMIGLFCGSPGTGKTYSSARLIGQARAEGQKVVVCAPTGKAAVRITESMAEYGLGIKARTIHSTLGVSSAGDEGWTFRHNEHHPLEANLIVVDESSMIDTSLMASLIKARSKGTKMLFVGDTNQLPPVGHGAPLRDMIAAGFPYGELREIIRNDGGIVQACADIRDGKQFSPGGNLVHREATTTNQSIRQVFDFLDYVSSCGADKIWDAQILVPVNKNSQLSRVRFNEILQDELNSNGSARGVKFRPDDKIICLKNSWYPATSTSDDEDVVTDTSGNVYVANGEIGRVLESSSNKTIVELKSPKREVLITKATSKAWDLAYAITVHKSQGDQWPFVGVILDDYPGAKMVFSREAMYTAISRAKRECHLVGQIERAWTFCRRTQIQERKTFLVESINQLTANLEIGLV